MIDMRIDIIANKAENHDRICNREAK